jgi:hypothetical protein
VVRIEPSHFDAGTFYVAFDNHRVNDFAPYLYVTTDYGKTFRSIANDLPTGGPDFLHVIREDPVNRDLLFVGTDVGVYVSLDRGAHWQKFMTGLPTVPVHDLKIHPRDGELIAATHGRSIWIVDITPLQQMRPEVLASAAHLFAPKTAYQFGEAPPIDYSTGHKAFEGASAPYGAEIIYRLTSGSRRDTVKIVVTDVKGDTVQTLTGPGGAGLHRVMWNLRGKMPATAPLSPAQRRDSVVAARKMDQIFDSLATAQVAPKPVLDRLRAQIAGGGGFGGFGRGAGGAPGSFVERPGEGAAPRAPGAGAAGSGGGATGGQDIDPELRSDIMGVLRSSGALQGGGGGGRRGGAPFVMSGDYLVTVTLGGQTQRQVLRVERVSGDGGEAVASMLQEDEEHEP